MMAPVTQATSTADPSTACMSFCGKVYLAAFFPCANSRTCRGKMSMHFSRRKNVDCTVWNSTATHNTTPVIQCSGTHENLSPRMGRNALASSNSTASAVTQWNTRSMGAWRVMRDRGLSPWTDPDDAAVCCALMSWEGTVPQPTLYAGWRAIRDVRQ